MEKKAIICEKEVKKIGLVGRGTSNRAVEEYLGSKYPYLTFTYISDATERTDEHVLFFSPSARREGLVPGVGASSDCELYFSLSGARTYAVTGSDGKSTTAVMAGMLLGAPVMGNIGRPFITSPSDAPRIVAELSSFQLLYFAPRAYSAVLTSISENHLDMHRDYGEYVGAKVGLLRAAEHVAVWADTEEEVCIGRGLSHRRCVLSFDKSEVELSRVLGGENYVCREGTKVKINGEAVVDAARIANYGLHNLRNFMSAVALTLGDVTREEIERAVREFKPLEHRCTLVKEACGVRYYDSSIDTTPSRTAVTLSNFERGVILLLGGKDKGLDLGVLKRAMCGRVKCCISFGASAERYAKEIEGCIPFPTLYDAVGYAKSVAVSGDVVLLSPAGASYDEFSDYKERGHKFKDWL